MAKALCPKCKTVLEQPVPQCPSCGVKFKAKAPAPAPQPAAPMQAAPQPPKDEVFDKVFGDDELPPAPPPAPKPVPRAAAPAPRPASPQPAAKPAETPAAAAEAFDPDAARVFAEAFTARRASAPPEPEPAKPTAPVYEEPVYVPQKVELVTPVVRLKTESLHPKNLIPGFLFFVVAAHMFVFNDGGVAVDGLLPALGAGLGMTVLTLGFDYWRFSR